MFNPYFCYDHVEVALHPYSAYASSHSELTAPPTIRKKHSHYLEPSLDENKLGRSHDSVDSSGSDYSGENSFIFTEARLTCRTVCKN